MRTLIKLINTKGKPSFQVDTVSADDRDYDVKFGGKTLFSYSVGDIRKQKLTNFLMEELVTDGYEAETKTEMASIRYEML